MDCSKDELNSEEVFSKEDEELESKVDCSEDDLDSKEVYSKNELDADKDYSLDDELYNDEEHLMTL